MDDHDTMGLRNTYAHAGSAITLCLYGPTESTGPASHCGIQACAVCVPSVSVKQLPPGNCMKTTGSKAVCPSTLTVMLDSTIGGAVTGGGTAGGGGVGAGCSATVMLLSTCQLPSA